MRLSTNESEIFSYRKGFTPSEWDEKYCYDINSFSRRGLGFANNTISDIIKKKIEPIFIAEIGLLELQGKGFAEIFTLLLKMNKEGGLIFAQN